MPRAYAPRLATVQRAARIAAMLGLLGWHLYRNHDGEVSIMYGIGHRKGWMTLKDAERRLAAQR